MPGKKGRPSLDRKALTEKVEQYRDGPATNYELSKYLGISSSTLDMIMKENDAFLDAVKRARARADDRVVASLFDRAIGFSYEERTMKSGVGRDGNAIEELTVHEKEVVPDVGAQKHWLHNRRRKEWSGAQKVEIDHGPGWGEMLAGMRRVIGEGDDDA